jgi:RNA polymerase sigma-70 factor (ECF subfamily)
LLQPPLAQNSNDDYALMRAITAGDAVAFKTFYARHSAVVYTLCVRMIRDSQEAEQLLTDVFFEIWSSRGRYDETRSNPLTYLMRITRSRAIDKLRRKGPVGGVSLDPGSGIDVAIEDAPSTLAEADESRVIVIKALRVLDVEQRRVIECSYYEGLSHAQIATKLNKPLGTVKSCMRQGLVRLRELLSRSQGTESEQPL